MGFRAWWQRLWRRLRHPADNSMTVDDARMGGKETIAKWDTRHRGGSVL